MGEIPFLIAVDPSLEIAVSHQITRKKQQRKSDMRHASAFTS
jgi:hypothetical protein